MPATTLREVMEAIYDALAAGLPGAPAGAPVAGAWRRSPTPVPSFPRDSGIDGHLAYTVGYDGHEWLGGVESSQILRPAMARVRSRWLVRWSHRLRPGAGAADTEDAMGSVSAVVAAMQPLCAGPAATNPGGLRASLLGVSPGYASGDGTLQVFDLRVEVVHQFSTLGAS